MCVTAVVWRGLLIVVAETIDLYNCLFGSNSTRGRVSTVWKMAAGEQVDEYDDDDDGVDEWRFGVLIRRPRCILSVVRWFYCIQTPGFPLIVHGCLFPKTSKGSHQITSDRYRLVPSC
jgi:hypothetical protein